MELDYEALLADQPWIVEREQDCILSPDSDGLLCGLFLSHHLGWRVRGFYDGKVLVVERGIKPRACVFLDMEIYRAGVRSIGQHMVMYDKKRRPQGWNAFANCISANNLHDYDFKNDFKTKYPLGTIHLLAAIVSRKVTVQVGKSAVSPLLYADGTFKNQFNYPENCIEWLKFLGATVRGNPLQSVFMDPHYSTYELMLALRDLFLELQRIGGGKRGGDKIRISDSKGNIVNIDSTSAMQLVTITQARELLEMLADKTAWTFDPARWSWGPYDQLRFKKGSVRPGKARYEKLLAENPLSFAIISRASIEYTLDPEGIFLEE